MFGTILRLALLLVLAGAAFKALAHEQWANGDPVPSWVKASCCGPEDVHHLEASQVRAMVDGWHVEGRKDVIAYGRELPSQDGDYWIFYKDNRDESGAIVSQSPVYCFFAPAQSF